MSVRTIGGGGTSSGTAGFTDTFAIRIKADDSNAGQTDDISLAMEFTDSADMQSDALTLAFQQDDVNSIQDDTDTYVINLLQDDPNAIPTDVDSYVINLTQDETNDAQSETVELAFPSPDFGDSSDVPTDVNVITMRVWLSGSSGTGSTNPANANSSNDAAVATLTTVVLGTNPITLTSALGANVPNVNVTSAVYRGWFKSVNVVVTSSGVLKMHSTTAAFADITMFTNAALATTVDHLSGDFTFDLVAAGVDTLAKIQSCQMLHIVSDAVAGVTPHILTVDSGCIEVVGAF